MLEPKGTTTPGRGRVALLSAVVLLMAGAIGARLYQIQVLDSDAFRARASRQHNSTVSSAPTRGAILDRDGRALAVSLETETLFAHPPAVEKPEEIARLLAPVLGVTRSRLLGLLESDKPFVYLKRFLDPATADAVRALDQARVQPGRPGIPLGSALGFLSESKRVYPKGPLAVHALGFANIDGMGIEGIEQRYDDVLRGDTATYFVTRDARNRLVRSGVGAPGRQPHDIVLALDAVLQHRVERELERAMRETGARAASAILLDPTNGEVLALANRPAVDPNFYGEGTDEARRNRALADFYEPGSTFKPVPLALALDTGVLRANQSFHCENGLWQQTAKRRIRDTSPHATLTVRQVLAKSSNIGMVKATRNLTPESFLAGIERFGFGQKTGIELTGESAGLVRGVPDWSDLTPASLAFGQEIGVTVLQMASAIGTVANDGVRVPPRIVLGTRDATANLIRAEVPAATRVISAVTAAQLRSMMESVIDEGTGTRARVAGYRLAGKSGTAQKAIKGGYSATDYMASFGGFGPVDNPRIVAMVVLDSPAGEWTHGGQVAAPVFGRIMAEALPHLRVPSDDDPEPVALRPDEDLLLSTRLAPVSVPLLEETPAGAVPNLIGLDLREAVRRLSDRGYRALIDGSGSVIGQWPAPGTPLLDGEPCRLLLGQSAAVGGPAPGVPETEAERE